MQYSMMSTHLRARGEALLAGQFEQVIQDYLYPLPIFMESTQMVIHTPHHARLVFRHLHQALVSRGVVMLRPTIAAVDLPRAGRFRVWVDWLEVSFPAEATRISQAIYYCRQTDLGLRTEMVNYTHLSMPELNSQFAALALSA